ncbi:MAG: hypothetical protein K2K09_07975, partial [Lachnospiraceae bacterium]|nr:hypothetical protein [Lachnospiraceae bacterium]
VEVLQGYLDRIGEAIFPVPNTDMPFLLAALELHLKELRRRCGDNGCEIAENLMGIFSKGIYTVEICPDGKEDK